MKRLYFLRHGEADHPGRTWTHDSVRPLTEEGRETMIQEARGLRKLRIPIDAIVTSPYLRSRQTADIVALEYRLVDRMIESEYLEPGASFPDLRKALSGVEGHCVLVVGHQPDLGYCVGQLVGAQEIPLSKGTLAQVGLDEGIKENSGRLEALLPAELLALIGRLTA